jgi:hypothetical protein
MSMNFTHRTGGLPDAVAAPASRGAPPGRGRGPGGWGNPAAAATERRPA